MAIPPTTPCRTDRIAVGPVALAVATYGGPEPGAPTLVLLHGIGSRAVSWWPVVDDLAAHFRLVAVDLRGHGDSDKPAAGYLLPAYAADLDGLLAALGLDRPLLLGHSLGGLIALTWAVDHPDAAAAIALEDTTLRGGPALAPAFDGWLALSRLTPAQAAAHYAREHPEWTAEECCRRAESITAVAPAVFAELRDDNLRAVADGGSGDRIAPLAGIRSPLLLVHGDLEAGGMVHPDDATRLAVTVPNARVVRIPGASHSLHRDRPRAFLDAVVPFLEGRGAGGEG